MFLLVNGKNMNYFKFITKIVLFFCIFLSHQIEMKKMGRIYFIVIYVLFWLLGSLGTLFAQDASTLEDDANILRGTLSNGLTYYIIHNNSLDASADFYLVQKTGILSDGYRNKGYSELISQLALESTYNFNEITPREYLYALGLDLSVNLKVDVGLESTTYRISDIPLTSKNVVDSTLMLLYNWADRVEFEGENLNNIKQYLANSHLKEMDLENREWLNSHEHLLVPMGYPQLHISSYDDYLSLASITDIEDYYDRLYIPENQAIIVVGDVDVDDVLAKIETLFLTIPKGEMDTVHNIYLSEPEDILVNKYEDVDSKEVKIDFYYTTDILPEKYRLSAVPYVMDFLNFTMTELIENRIILQARQVGLYLDDVSVSFGRYLGVSQMDALNIEILCQTIDAREVYRFAIDEIEKIRRFGFSIEEGDHIAENYIVEAVEYSTDSAQVPNFVFADRCVSHYLDGYNQASLSQRQNYLLKAKEKISIYDVNTFTRAHLKTGASTVTSYSYAPDSLINFTEQDVKQWIVESQYSDLSRFELFEENMFREQPSRLGKQAVDSEKDKDENIVEFKNSSTNTIFWVAKNGMKVIYKQMETYDGRIVFEALSDDPFTEDLYYDIPNALKTEMKSRGVELEFCEYDSHLSIRGSSSQRQVEFFMQVLERYSINPSNFSILIMGSMAKDDIKELVEVYLASVPEAKDRSPRAGNINKAKEDAKQSEVVYVEMEEPSTSYNYQIDGELAFNLENYLKVELLNQYINVYTREVMKDLGVEIDIKDVVYAYPYDGLSLSITWQMRDYDPQLIENQHLYWDRLAQEGITQHEFELVKKIVARQYDVKEATSREFWREMLRIRFVYGKDYFTNYEKELESITLDDFNMTLRTYLSEGAKYSTIQTYKN